MEAIDNIGRLVETNKQLQEEAKPVDQLALELFMYVLLGAVIIGWPCFHLQKKLFAWKTSVQKDSDSDTPEIQDEYLKEPTEPEPE